MIEHYQKLLCSMDTEQWKTIKEFPSYQVSNMGNVRNAKTHNILKPIAGNRYPRVCLYSKGKKKYLSIHRLVISYFVENKYPKLMPYVNHVDENKHNNRADNLEWCTAKYNYNWSKDSAIRGAIQSAKDKGKTKAIVVYNIFSGRAILYDSTREAGRSLNIFSGNMTPVLRHKGNHVLMKKKYMLFYKDDWTYQTLKDNFSIMEKEFRIPRRIVALDMTTDKEYYFRSMRQAEKELGFPHQAISRCLKDGQLSTHGYKFKWDNSVKKPKLPDKLPELTVYKKN